MPKPNVLQKILNQPSQSYASPPPSVRQYHSTKAELVRVAARTEGGVGVGGESGYEPKNIPSIPDVAIFGSSPRRVSVREDVIHTDSPHRYRSASVRHSHHSGIASDPHLQIRQPSGGRVIYDSSTPHAHGDSDSDSEHDVFYTPLSSPYSSPHTSMALSDTALVIPPVPISVPPKPIPEPQQSSLAAFTFPWRADPSEALPVPKTNGEANGRRSYTYSSSSSSDGDDDVSIFSSSTSPMSASTQITSPPQSISGHKQSLQRRGTISSTGSGPGVMMVTVSTDRPRVRGQGHKRTQSVGVAAGMGLDAKDKRKAVYTDNDWARDVRWLQNGNQMNGLVNLSAASGTRTGSNASTASPKGKGKSKDSVYIHHPWDWDERERMSAVMEEDEDDLSTIGNRNSNYSNRSRNRPRTHSTPSTSQLRPSHTVHRGLTGTASHTGVDISKSQSQVHRPHALGNGSESGHSYAQSYSHSYTTRDLPTPIPTNSSSTTTHTYTGLVLPRAGQGLTQEKTLLGIKKKNKEFTGGGGKVDLTQSGMATTTMATVEIVRGVAGALWKKKKPFKRSSSRDEGASRGHVPESETPLALTSHLPPPSYVPSNSVLVQVWAAGLDSIDERLVREAVSDIACGKGGKAVGYVPGRSVVGRAVEVGSSVREHVCRRSDWVVGLLDIRKCGALAEFVLVERHRLHRVPPPSAPGSSENASLSRSSSYRSHYSRSSHSESRSPSGSRTSHTRSQSLASTPTYINARAQGIAQMTIEELALLPLVGVPAYRVLRTFERVIELRRVVESEGNLARKRALVLRGHDGVGAIVTQLLARRGVEVSVFVPGGVIDVGDLQGKVDLNEVVEERMLTVEKRLKGWGAAEILWGTATRGDSRDREDALEAVQRLAGDGEEFDMVLDTIGGRDVWMACKAILGVGAGLSATQFTTTVGDFVDRVVPTAQDHFWAGLRSMGLSRGGSVKKKGQAGEKVAATLVTGSPSISTKGSVRSQGKSSVREKGKEGKEKKEIGYAWVSVSADVDMEGEDIADTMNALLHMIKDSDIRPWVGPTDVDTYEENGDDGKVLPFEKAPELFSRASLLRDGGTAVVKIAA
ncbi:hypothetical protein NEOLEDRAFT_1182384 [Neolentinus lepideus HHB14362 ss-1]|uniref:Enoyl reductase (ER) domain-containing protein n=1 Tax=Neolentinus lepideus HHB14362 ss-1 TaxID=1314782 RepID=A0A165P7Z7_9AGAM|nr:hypothetical protein NEOLEDRAFT_1182384 [Neolentinus lepideus HHB14362 ss-1]